VTLAERLAKPPVDTRNQFCTVGKLLGELFIPGAANTDHFALAAALEDSNSWTATDLARALAAEGHQVTYRHIRQHRHGEHTARECAWPDTGIEGGGS